VIEITALNINSCTIHNMDIRTIATMPTPKPEDDSIIAHFSDGLLIHFKKDDVIIQVDEEPEGVYLIKSGFVRAYSISRDGQKNLLLIHKDGEFIPLPWALDGGHTSGMFYEAMTNVEVLRAGKNQLRTAMGKNTWLSREVLAQTVNVVSVYTQRIQTLEYRSAKERIISEIVYLSARFGEKQGKQIIINAPITHQDIADSINMTRETASRALEQLFDSKLMGQKNHLFTVFDIDKLKNILG
jgi:CRP/FNR family transcriptional regulator